MKGTYTVVVECGRGGYAMFGSLGRARLRTGRYLYTGSAMGTGAASLESRLRRHERRQKSARWHIDYLTSKPGCRVSGAVYAVCDRRLECVVNQRISEELVVFPVLPRIGATDCNCSGHLLGPLNLTLEPLLGKLIGIYGRVSPRRARIILRKSD